MVETNYSQSREAIAPIIERIITTRHLSRGEHLQLVTTILSDYKVTEVERSQLNRVFDELQLGHLKFID
jgi:hypothetical protein